MNNPFKSFHLGGYECADMLNRHGERVDLLLESGHLRDIVPDYQNLSGFRIKTVREGIRWSKTEIKPYQYDWHDLDLIMAAGKYANIQQLWDLCHFGFPDDLTPLHPAFEKRFTAFCIAFVKHYRSMYKETVLIVTPINEVSFLSWLGGEVAATTPYARGIGAQVKYELTKAYIAAVKAMRMADPGILIMSTEPLVDIVPPPFAGAEERAAAYAAHEEQYKVLDMILGRACPELGGNESLIDIIGCNFYYSNRFSSLPGDVISWINEFDDERFRPLHELMMESYDRYRKPHILAETSHPGEDRSQWFRHILSESDHIISAGIPFWGICWYPLTDRPDWDDLSIWHHSGLWDRENRYSVPVLYEALAGVYNDIYMAEKLSLTETLETINY